ncbi:MAG: outer membrane lipoprotein-sorting protein [Bacteroidota bacterium]
MKKLSYFFAFFLLPLLAFQPDTVDDPKAIIQKAQDKLNGNSSKALMTMKIIRPDWTREMSLKSWSSGEDLALVLVTSPARDRGIAFLKREKEMWNWQPSIDRVVKLPPSMMMQSWMGSDLKNDDLVNQSSPINDYDHKLLGEEEIDGMKCWKIEMLPHDDVAVVWGKIIVWVEMNDYIELKSEFYDEDGFLINTISGKDIKRFGDRNLPSRLEVVPAEEEGHKTILEYTDLQFDIPMKESFFSIQNMKRVR